MGGQGRKDEQQPAKEGSMLYQLWMKRKKHTLQSEEDAQAESAAPSDTEEAEAQSAQSTPEDVSFEPGDVPEPESALGKMWACWRAGQPEEQTCSVREFVNDETDYRRELAAFQMAVEQTAKQLLAKRAAQYQTALDQWEAQVKRAEEARQAGKQVPPVPETPPAPLPADAKVQLQTAKNKLRAWLFAFPPENGGGPVTRDMIEEALRFSHVAGGLDEERLAKIVEEQAYLRIFTVARGEAPVDGKDGLIKDLFPRELEIHILQDENGLADFKNLGIVHNVAQDEVICEITPPTESKDGFDVLGHKLRARPGRPAQAPQGTNTMISPETGALVATVGGHILFEGGRFLVQKVLEVDGDVDNSTGNLDFSGDIHIQGDVREGYEVRAKGNIQVDGMVEGAVLLSEGSVAISNGMNGSGRGRLEVKGDIKCKYIENCTVYCSGNIVTGSVIYSNIYCDGELNVRAGKGVLVGGECTVLKKIDAKIIGSESNRLTSVTLGHTPSLLGQKHKLQTELKTTRETLEEITKTLNYMEHRSSAMSRNQEAVLNQMKLKRPLLLIQEKQLENQLEDLLNEMENVADSRIKCDVMYAPTKITIGVATLTTDDVHYKCNVYSTEGEIRLGAV